MFKGSWKTTLVGVLTGLAMIIPQALNLIDDDPATILSMDVCFGGLAAMGFGWFTRDNNKSSEDVSAGK